MRKKYVVIVKRQVHLSNEMPEGQFNCLNLTQKISEYLHCV